MDSAAPYLKAAGLSIGYKMGSRELKKLAGPLDLEMHSGQLICLLGPNGAGKSTLIRSLAGLQPALSGKVEVGGKDLLRLKPPERAKQLSMVLTERVRSGNLTVFSIVALGRFPYTNWLGTLDEGDKVIIQWAMQMTETTPFAGRKLDELSDGESQKVMLARAMAQDTPVIILDEPTAHLDLPNRVSLMRLLHQLARKTGKAILLSTHDLDLALQTADQVWLLRNDGQLLKGAPEDLVLNGSLEAAFHREGFHYDRSSGTFIIHPPGEQTIYVKGDGAALFWTKRALLREGYGVAIQPARRSIEIEEVPDGVQWIYQCDNHRELHHSIESLLAFLKRKNKETSNLKNE